MAELTDKDTIITVGVTEHDEYGNLWITPQGGGEKVKIAAKRSKLHPIFQQGKAVILHWETYMNKPYVSDAKPVEGELPPPTKPIEPAHAEGEEIILPKEPSGQTIGMCWKEIGELIRTDKISFLFGKENAIKITKEYRGYLLAMLRLPFDGKKLPQWETEK